MEGAGVTGEGHRRGDVGHTGYRGVGGDDVVAGLNVDGQAVVFLQGVVEEEVPEAVCCGMVVVAVDTDYHVHVVDRLVVVGVKKEVGVGEVDEQLFAG